MDIINEHYFDRNDVNITKHDNQESLDTLDINLGSDTSPQIIKIGKDLSKEERDELKKLLREFKDVFAWSYIDLKAYSPKIIQHTIPLKEGEKPMKQKMRWINPKIAPLFKKLFQKMVNVGIITPIRNSS